MKARNIYDNVEAASFVQREVLKPDGYVCKIIDVELLTNQWGEKLVIHFDIAEGDSKGHYQKRYDNKTDENEGWKGNYRVSVPSDDGSEEDSRIAARFKTFIQEVEDSNTGYRWDWDEKKLKGKLVGILFSEKEWSMNGKTGFFTNPRYTTTVANIKDGKFKIPPIQYLDGKGETAPAQTSGDGFMSIPTGSGEDLPFN